MQREDVERLADLMTAAATDWDGKPARSAEPLVSIPTCGDALDIAAALRALLAERDAAFAAGQESMRERAGRAADENTFGGGAVAEAIRALPITDRPTSAEAPPPRATARPD